MGILDDYRARPRPIRRAILRNRIYLWVYSVAAAVLGKRGPGENIVMMILAEASAKVAELESQLVARDHAAGSLIQKAESLCEAATPGPWSVDAVTGGLEDYGDEDKVISRGIDGPGEVGLNTGEQYQMYSAADASFIATARTLVPELAEALSELQTQLSDVVCKKIEDMSEGELRSLCLLNGTTLEETASHTRYVIKAALRQVDLENKMDRLIRERDEARAELEKWPTTDAGRLTDEQLAEICHLVAHLDGDDVVAQIATAVCKA